MGVRAVATITASLMLCLQSLRAAKARQKYQLNLAKSKTLHGQCRHFHGLLGAGLWLGFPVS